MTPARRRFAESLSTGVLPVAAVALIVGVACDATSALAAAAAGLLLVIFVQITRLTALATWLDAPHKGDYPDIGGVWSEIFQRVSQQMRDDAHRCERAEAGLHSFREAMDAVPNGLLILDSAHQIQWGNRSAEEHLGIRLVHDTGTIIEQRVRIPGFAEHLANPDTQTSFVLQSPALRARSYAVRVLPLGQGSKLLVSLDVTDARRVEAMRSEFVANVSHELRTPLTVVSGFLEHFADDSAMDAEQRSHFARLMSDQTARMLSLVDDLLTLSRLEADDVPASEEELDMEDLLARLLSEAKSLSEGRHRFAFSCLGPSLRGNRKELHSAFGNLVSNAIRYTPAGGDIRIAWTMDEGAGVFSVRDSGVGIAAEHLPRLTERFYRVDRGRSRDTGGTGLGLAIVKHILLRHQATLAIDSTVGQGSVFRATFPSWRLA